MAMSDNIFQIVIRRVLDLSIYSLSRMRKKMEVIPGEVSETPLSKWNKDSGDKMLRLNYDLSSNSIVFDLGGYEGDWATYIYAMYRPKIYVFEPVKYYYQYIESKFTSNPDIKVFPFGLSKGSRECLINLDANSSSIFKTGKVVETIQLKDFIEFITEHLVTKIDLIKINIEGAEYELLEYLLETDFVINIINIQVQFHTFVDNASERMKNIQKELSKTHHLTYQYDFVWENWSLNDCGSDRDVGSV